VRVCVCECVLRVRFPDGQIARSIGISAIALPSTSIPLPAHVFADDTLQQSLSVWYL
jgi:hypothetical protein